MAYSLRLLIILGLGIFGLILQGTIFKMLFGFNFFVPHSLLVLAILIAFIQPTTFGLLASFCLGLLADFSSVVLIGPWAAAFVVVFLIVSLFSQKLFYESGVTAFFVVLIMTFVASGIYLALELQFKKIDSSLLQLSSALLLEAFVTACFAPLVFPILGRRLNKYFEQTR